MLREVRARTAPNYDAACFHAQQCAEKYLKGKLQEVEVPFAKTHDLLALLAACLPKEPMWELLRRPLRVLNLYSVELRYPGESADKKMAQEALTAARAVRTAVRESLGCPVGES